MTLPLIGPLDRLRGLRGAVLGVDLSAARIAGCVLHSADASAAQPAVTWRTRTLVHAPHPAMRLVMAADTIVNYLQEVQADIGGPPARVAVEIPLAGRNTPLITLWMIGAFYVAFGEVWGSAVHVNEWNPSSWKAKATGSGYAPGLGKDASKAAKRVAEKARLGAWARDVIGYTGTIEDEQDATGVAVAEALLWTGR